MSLTVTNAQGSDTETKSAFITVSNNIATEEVLTGAGPAAGNAPVVKTWDHGTPPSQVVAFSAFASPDWGVNVAGADLVAGGVSEILAAAGPGPGYGPQVRGFHPDGTPISNLNFYGYGTLRYGVHASGPSLDSDATSEILTSPGPGAVFGPHLRGWNYDGGPLSAISRINVFAFSTLRWGRALGRRRPGRGDGYGEILAGAGAGAVFAPHVRGFDYDGTLLSSRFSLYAFGSGSHGATVSAADTDADGEAEVMAARGPSPAGDTRVVAFHATPSITAAWQFEAFSGLVGGTEIAGGDLDGDGQAEVVTARGWGVSAPATVMAWEITASSGTSIAGSTYDAYPGQSYGAKVATGDTGAP